jgi:hypothetical protein
MIIHIETISLTIQFADEKYQPMQIPAAPSSDSNSKIRKSKVFKLKINVLRNLILKKNNI